MQCGAAEAAPLAHALLSALPRAPLVVDLEHPLEAILELVLQRLEPFHMKEPVRFLGAGCMRLGNGLLDGGERRELVGPELP